MGIKFLRGVEAAGGETAPPPMHYISTDGDKLTLEGQYLGGVLGTDGNVYMFGESPHTGVARYNPNTHTLSGLLSPSSAGAASSVAFGGAVHGSGNRVILSPYASGKPIVVYDYVSGATTTNYGTSAAKYKQGTRLGDKTFFAPGHGATNMLVYDINTNAVTVTATIPGYTSHDNKIGGCIADSRYGIVWLVPENDTVLRYYTPASDTWTVVDVAPFAGVATVMAGSAKWKNGAFGGDGSLYFAPSQGSNFLRITPGVGTPVQSIEVYPSIATGFVKYMGGVTGVDGNVYVLPSYNSKIGVLELGGGAVTVNEASTHMHEDYTPWKYIGGVLTEGGVIVCVPHAGGSMLRLRPVWDTDAITHGVNHA